MNRLGLTVKELETVTPQQLQAAGVEMILSHLACADTPEHPRNAEQLARFRAALEALPGLRASLANSSGIFLGEDYHFDLARPGCALYGINPTPGKQNPMQPVATLSAPILQVREMAKADAVGYGATYEAKAGSRIATVGMGYADGFMRHLSNTAHGFVKEYKTPVVGRVSMDMVTVDVSAVPPALLEANPQVEFIGAYQSVDEFAGIAGTIGYEVFTRLGKRVKRVY
jgi:alanine racemase